MTLKPAIALAILGVSGRPSAQVQGRVGAALPQVQVERPATGLALHDFLYAGESHERNIYLDNFNPNLPADRASALQGCNQQLCNATRGSLVDKYFSGPGSPFGGRCR